LASSILWFIIAVSYIIGELNCTNFRIPILNIVITIGNAANICSSIILGVIRLRNPILKQQFKYILNKYCFCCCKNEDKNQLTDRNPSFMDNFIDKMKENNFKNMISGILIAESEYYNKEETMDDLLMITE
jgi:hypothetical protein